MAEVSSEAVALAPPVPGQATAANGLPADLLSYEAAGSHSSLLKVTEAAKTPEMGHAGVSRKPSQPAAAASAEAACQMQPGPAKVQTADQEQQLTDQPEELQLSLPGTDSLATTSIEPADDDTPLSPAQAARPAAAQPADQEAVLADAEHAVVLPPATSRSAHEQPHQQQLPCYEPRRQPCVTTPERAPASAVRPEKSASAPALKQLSVQQSNAEPAVTHARGQLCHTIISAAADSASPVDPAPGRLHAQQEAARRSQPEAATAGAAIGADVQADALGLLQGYDSDAEETPELHTVPAAQPATQLQGPDPLSEKACEKSSARSDQPGSQYDSLEVKPASSEHHLAEQPAHQAASGAGAQELPAAEIGLPSNCSDSPAELAAAPAADESSRADARPASPAPVPPAQHAAAATASVCAAADLPSHPQAAQELKSQPQQAADAPVGTAASPKCKQGRQAKPARLSLPPSKPKKAKASSSKQHQTQSSPLTPPPPQHSPEVSQVPPIDLWQGHTPVLFPPCSPSKPTPPGRAAGHQQAQGDSIAAKGGSAVAAFEQLQESRGGAQAAIDLGGAEGVVGVEVGSRHVTPASEASCSTELPEGQLAALQVRLSCR